MSGLVRIDSVLGSNLTEFEKRMREKGEREKRETEEQEARDADRLRDAYLARTGRKEMKP